MEGYLRLAGGVIMPLSTSDLGQALAWPLKFVKPSFSKTPTTNRAGVVCTPACLVKATYSAPTTLDADGFSVAHLGAAAAGTTSMTLGGALCSGGVGTNATPRNVVITVTHASSIVAMSGTITGTDEYGATITEAWAVTATGTSKTNTGLKAFKTVTSITEVVAADASGNTIIAGDGNTLGLAFKATNIVPIAELVDGATPTAGVIVAGSTTATADARGTYTPNSAPNASRVYKFYYTVDDPTDIT